MSNHRVLSDQYPCAQRSGAGTIRKIRLENFMCHSSLEIELCEWVNFITGQNGSGKSAILTALCIAFGCRAKETQRASKLNQFIKTGCSYAIVQVEIKNEGVDAFKPEIYGHTILIERRISDLTSSTALKDCRGKKVGSRKEDLRELVDHFNIDVENPCVIMSQDKSREFLHSGNDKDKFKFFFKATLLQQVDELLQSIKKQLNDAYALVDELENFIKPIQLELNELDGKIKNMERVEEISREVLQLGKQLAWSWVYDYDRKLEKQRKKIEVLKDRIPACQAKIDSPLHKLEKLRELFSEKKDQVACLVEKRADVKRREEELRNRFTAATKEKLELEGDYRLCSGQLGKMLNHLENLEQQANDIQEKHMRNTQAEQLEIEDQIKELENAVELLKSRVSSLKDEERILSERALDLMGVIQKINDEIKDYEKKRDEIRHQVNELSRHQTNKVTAFGGDGVLRLLREIERHLHKFTMPPIGPIGAHVKLVKGADIWAPAVEQAIGKLLNAFIVTDPKDANTLRACGKDARYNYFQIVIYKFSRPRLDIPNHMLPHTKHPTILSVLHSDNPTVFNVLVDTGKVERIVLVKDYNTGRAVVFEQRIPNVAEVLTIDGLRMFSRGSVQTVLPSRRTFKIGRLSGSFDDQIEEFKREVSNFEEEIKQSKIRKRESEQKHQDFRHRLDDVKRRRLDIERDLTFKSMKLRDVQNSRTSEDTVSLESTANELLQEISNVENEIHRKKEMLERLQEKMNEAGAKAGNLKLSFEDLSESTKREIETFKKAEDELSKIEIEIKNEEALKVYYEGLMNNKVLPDIKDAEAQYVDLENSRKESCQKASIICPESDINNLVDLGTPAELSAQLDRQNQRLKHERNRYLESIDDLRMLYQEKEHKILRKQQTYKGLREKLDACQEALNLRLNKFKRNAALLKRELTWQFNGHLGKKGISGQINVNYDEKALSVQVQMPQDASTSIVRDTRGLSGGERSFSTLCFTLALHDMTEAPFRAMDEFDVFMDAVSRKISLDTLVEFALRQGSQWIFITPHDISSVKQDERIKKQQMAAPRS